MSLFIFFLICSGGREANSCDLGAVGATSFAFLICLFSSHRLSESCRLGTNAKTS